MALIVFDAPERGGIRLVQDQAKDSIEKCGGVGKTFKYQALTRFPPFHDEDEAVAVTRDHLVVDDRGNRR